MHHCFNVVTQRADQPTAVLIRALEPVEGLDFMRSRRAAATRDRDLCNGPAKLCQAMSIDRACNARDLVTDDQLWIEKPAKPVAKARIVASPRIGVDYAQEWAAKTLRFCLQDSDHVSVKPRGSA
jgi:DNA-3-methyladenine glycosylase